jgi:hypothetical protein
VRAVQSEFMAKLACATARPGDDQRLLTFVTQPMVVVDLLAILPWCARTHRLVPDRCPQQKRATESARKSGAKRLEERGGGGDRR